MRRTTATVTSRATGISPLLSRAGASGTTRSSRSRCHSLLAPASACWWRRERTAPVAPSVSCTRRASSAPTKAIRRGRCSSPTRPARASSSRRVAGAFSVAPPTRLYGRYWGCLEQHPFLHFNVCYYHSIADCIARGLQIFEGGAGGEHKLARGFLPALPWSAHGFTDARLDRAVRDHLARETPARAASIERSLRDSPIFKAAS